MASIHKRPRSPFWHASFMAPDGRWTLRSTKCTDRQKALAVAMEFERASKLGRAGELVEAQARKVVADIMERAGSDETLRAPSVKKFFDDWLESKKARKSESTHARYSGAVDKFYESLKERQNKPLTSLTSSDVQRYLDSRAEEKLSPTTISLSVKVIRTALNHARRQGIIPTNPAEAVELPEVSTMERGTFTPEEIKMLVAQSDQEWKTLILVAYYTGARLSDCCRMAWKDVDLSEGLLTYIQAKTGTTVTVPLHAELLAHLNKLASTDKPETFISPNMAALKPGGRHGLSEGFKRIMRKAGIDSGAVKKTGVRQLSSRTFHALRHSFTSTLADNKVDPEVRMKLTGHKSAPTHRNYTHHQVEILRAAVNKMPSLS